MPDDNLSVDGVKEMVLEARELVRKEHPRTAQRITPQLLSIYFQYVRNLSLIDRRLTPDLYSVIVAAKQTVGDDFALAIAETARSYPYADLDSVEPGEFGSEPGFVRMGVNRAEVPGWGTAFMVSRLPGQAVIWRSCELRPRPPQQQQKRWRQRWDPFGMCSWPPEDDRIESFHRHVRDQAKAILGADLARVEKFTTSVRDGLDIRETLRNWHTGDLYVKVLPPGRGSIEAVVFLFEVPADPQALYPPCHLVRRAYRGIDAGLLCDRPDEKPDRAGYRAGRLWRGAVPVPSPADSRDLDRSSAPVRRYARRAALGCRLPAQRRPPCRGGQSEAAAWLPGAGWLAGTAARLVHLPLKRFSGALLERLRTFHVLNGKQVRSYAADYIRDL